MPELVLGLSSAEQGVEQIVLRRAFLAEWEEFGEACWKRFVFRCFHLRKIKAFCALMQRVGIAPGAAAVEQI